MCCGERHDWGWCYTDDDFNLDPPDTDDEDDILKEIEEDELFERRREPKETLRKSSESELKEKLKLEAQAKLVDAQSSLIAMMSKDPEPSKEELAAARAEIKIRQEIVYSLS